MSCSLALSVSSGAIIKCDKLYMAKEWHWVTGAREPLCGETRSTTSSRHFFIISGEPVDKGGWMLRIRLKKGPRSSLWGSNCLLMFYSPGETGGSLGSAPHREDGTRWPSSGFHGTDSAERVNKQATLPPVAGSGHARAILHKSLHGYLIH